MFQLSEDLFSATLPRGVVQVYCECIHCYPIFTCIEQCYRFDIMMITPYSPQNVYLYTLDFRL